MSETNSAGPGTSGTSGTSGRSGASGMSGMPPMPAWPRGEEDAPARPAERPRVVQLAVYLMYLGAALSAVSAIAVFGSRDRLANDAREMLRGQKQPLTPDKIDATVNTSLTLYVVFGVLAVALWILMAVMNGKGQPRARVVATVLAVANVFNTVLTGLSIVGLALLLTGTAAAVMLWLPAARPWFTTTRRLRV
ncbi:hypothetical protein [Actinopolymorpha singaporensis]|uniref:Uncharacterized protein n=1 Tax=Actinopolymorpha singaporensis TaxID=117157 RepID=A0A1H1LUS3_9ACTN|nr:hypothetical protein [Actinopolymorpha singaporensis]SDR78253.1 hypothetical protein SAMN04489717_0540 [Actinopolymorpha singaporensis]